MKQAHWMVFFLAVVLVVCSCRKPIQYYPVAAKRNLQKFKNYLEEISGWKGRIPEVPVYDGKYPVNVRVSARNQFYFLIPEPYRIPYNQEIPSSELTPQNKFEGMYFVNFMYDGYSYLRPSDGKLIQYISNGEWFLLDGCGPDGKQEIDWLLQIDKNKAEITTETLRIRIAEIMYDPTNGSHSGGDIILLSH